MSKGLTLQVPINSTSLGQTATCFLHEVFLNGLEPDVFPIGNPDLSSYNGLLSEDFIGWLQGCISKAPKNYSRKNPSLRWWHCVGSHESVASDERFLMTFHETDVLTPTESNIFNSFDKVFVPCEFNRSTFQNHGVSNVVVNNLGFDSLAYKVLEEDFYPENITTIIVNGKLEKRKRHDKVLKILSETYGNDKSIKIHLHLYNRFLASDQKECALKNNAIIERYLGQKLHNVSIYGMFDSLQELNKAYNCADVVVDGSGGESWSLPSFHCVGLGKHAVLHYNSGIKDWATKENATLVEPSSKIKAEDGLFFKGDDSPYNVGNFFDFNEETFCDALVKTVEKARKNKVNKEGLKLQNQFTWKKFTDKILSEMSIN